MEKKDKDNQLPEEEVIVKDQETMEEAVPEDTAVPEERSVEERADSDTSDEEENSREHKHHHHHHHKSHHGHHSSHHRKSSKKRSRNWKKFWKKNKKFLMPVVVILIVGVILGGIVLAVELISDHNSNQGKTQTEGTEGTVILSASVFDEEISLSSQAALDIVKNQDLTASVRVLLEKYNTEKNRVDVCQPVQIAFYVVNKPVDYEVDRFVVEVAENNGFVDAQAYTLDAQQKKIDLYNLKTDTQYYYRVNVQFTNGAFSSVGGGFRTAEGPRILSIGGIRNVRDIGTWKTTDGRSLKQGLLYRGTELDGNNNENGEVFKLTEEGKKVLLDILKIKTDMDLRWAKEIPEGVDPFGDTVEHICYGTPQYTDVFLNSGHEAIRKIFADLADPGNYPIYLHCIYGRDRTGTVCALLLAILGVSEEDIYREYQLTALHNKNLDSAFNGFLSQLKQFEGNTIQEKAETFLRSVGVTDEEITSIRGIFLG